MLSRAVAVINGKGGVGKTSLTANLSGLIAAAGYRVLAIDLDPQGNLARDLGYKNTPDNDDGLALFSAVTTGQQLRPVTGVRDGLDIVCGGGRIAEMVGALHSRTARGVATATAVHDAVAPIAENYDLLLIDCPPGEQQLQQMALTAAEFALIPTKSDSASLDGLVKVAELFGAVRATTNPDLQLLGVVLFGIGVSAKRIAQAARDAVARDLGSSDLVFDARIRHVEGAAVNTRDLGRLVHEIEAELPQAQKTRLAALRDRRAGGKHRADDDGGPRLAASASGLAEDYAALAKEVTDRIAAASGVTA